MPYSIVNRDEKIFFFINHQRLKKIIRYVDMLEKYTVGLVRIYPFKTRWFAPLANARFASFSIYCVTLQAYKCEIFCILC